MLIVSDIVLKVKNFGVIKRAEIDISKINVIAGVNSSGKSTLVKLLYCFLKSNSINRQKMALDSISGEINNVIIKSTDDVALINDQLLSKTNDFHENLQLYESSKVKFQNKMHESDYDELVAMEFHHFDELIDIIKQNASDLYVSLMRKLLKSEFLSDELEGHVELSGFNGQNQFRFACDFDNHDFNDDGLFYNQSNFYFTDVFLLDSYSILDLSHDYGLRDCIHSASLKNDLQKESDESNRLFDDKRNRNIIDLEAKIDEIINGRMNYSNGDLTFISDGGVKTYMGNTASGVKQIGIIQLLLKNRKLKENSFLIIDEPEVSLHPQWQVKLAEILVLLASQLNVHVYINTHSPMFVEAMSVFSEWYGLLDSTNFYLNEMSENGYDFYKINNKDMGIVYENLASPYDDLDLVKSKILSRK